MSTRNPADPFPLDPSPGRTFLGEIITWNCAGSTLRQSELVEALRAAGLDERTARELAPRHAFSRACRKLARERIIRQVAEDDAHIRFQFTAEHRAGERFDYALETMLTLHKQTGAIDADHPALATLAQAELDRCLIHRNGSDVTRLVQRLFERQADLFPIREQGGAYFVPAMHRPFVDQVQDFLGRIRGRLGRFPVPAGTREGDRSVREAVASGLASLIQEYRQAVASFDADTRPGTWQRTADRIQQARFKIEVYSTYLADERSRLERELQKAQQELRTRLETLTEPIPALGAMA